MFDEIEEGRFSFFFFFFVEACRPGRLKFLERFLSVLAFCNDTFFKNLFNIGTKRQSEISFCANIGNFDRYFTEELCIYKIVLKNRGNKQLFPFHFD